MKIDIKYCVPCGYLPRAEELRKKLEKEFKAQVVLVEGARGVFDVTVEGELIFSKHKEGRFPEWEEIKRKMNK